MQDMQRKINLLMQRQNLIEENEAVAVLPHKRFKKSALAPDRRSTPSIHEEESQVSTSSVNDGAMVHTLTSSLPTYDGRGEPQKLHEFIQKHDDFFEVADLKLSLVLALTLAKLSGPTYLWWHDHISKYAKNDKGHI